MRPTRACKLVNADILRLDAVMEALEGIDGVFHTAFFITVPLARNLWTGMDVNVRGLMNVLEACRWQKVPRIVYSSSIAAYGHPSGPVVDESAGFQPAGMKPAAALYGAAKVMGEQLCAFYRERHGLDFAALRYATVYGERQHRRGMHVVAIMAAYEAARRGEAPVIEGDGTDEHDYVYAGDVARANLLAMQSDRSRRGLHHRDRPLDPGGRGAAAWCSTPAARRTAPRFTRVAADNPNAYQSVPRFDISKAERELGWKPLTSLDAGIRRLVAWCDAHPAP